jgi:hypothetical protein
MKSRLGSEDEDGAVLLGSAGFDFANAGSMFVGGKHGSVFTDENKAVIFNTRAAPAAELTTPMLAIGTGSSLSLGSDLGGTDGGDSGNDGNDGNDGSSGVVW